MRKSKQAKRRPGAEPSKAIRYSSGRIEGGLLAVRMIEDIAALGKKNYSDCMLYESASTEDDNIVDNHVKQKNVAAKYMQRLTGEVNEGFCAVLTCYVALAEHDSAPNSGWLYLLAKYPPVIAQEKWEQSGHGRVDVTDL